MRRSMEATVEIGTETTPQMGGATPQPEELRSGVDRYYASQEAFATVKETQFQTLKQQQGFETIACRRQIGNELNWKHRGGIIVYYGRPQRQGHGLIPGWDVKQLISQLCTRP
eukprot:1452281-Amphidinium_carterae.1